MLLVFEPKLAETKTLLYWVYLSILKLTVMANTKVI